MIVLLVFVGTNLNDAICMSTITYQSTMIIQALGPVALKTSAIYAVHWRISISHTLSVPRSM